MDEREERAMEEYGVPLEELRAVMASVQPVQTALNEIMQRHLGDQLLEAIALVTHGPAALMELPKDDRIPAFRRACDTILGYHKSMQVLQ